MNVERATIDDIPELVELRLAYLTEDGSLLGLSVVELKSRRKASRQLRSRKTL